MNILYISSLIFGKSSSAAIRNTSLIKALKNRGCNIEIMTIEYPESKVESYFEKDLYEFKTYKQRLSIYNYNKNGNDNIKYRSSNGKLKKLVKNVLFFPDTDKEWINKVDLEFLNTSSFDLVISSSDTKTSHFVGELVLKQIRKSNPNVKWFQIWGDPWHTDVNLEFYQRYRAKKNEHRLLKKADKIFYISEPTMLEMQRTFSGEKEKMYYLPRSYYKEIYGKEKDNKNLSLVYTGVLNANRNLNVLLESIDLFNKTNNIKFTLDIYGTLNIEDITALNSPYVNLHGVVSLEEIHSIYENADALLFIDNGKNSTQIPGKIFDYFGTDRPILALVSDLESEVSRFIKKENRAVIYENKNGQIDLNTLIGAKSLSPLKKYSPDLVAEKLMSYFEDEF